MKKPRGKDKIMLIRSKSHRRNNRQEDLFPSMSLQAFGRGLGEVVIGQNDLPGSVFCFAQHMQKNE